MLTTKRIITSFMLIAIVIATIALASCKPKSKETITITLDWTANTNHSGIYVAKELGYFAEQGLDVKILEPGQAVTDQLVANGNSHFGVSYQENVIRARSENIPLVSIAAIIQHNTSGFASLKKDNILHPRDFEGKRYGSWDSPSEMAILQSVMKIHDADFSKVKVISGVYDFFNTIGKDADFEWIFEGWSGVEASLRGIELNYIPLRDLHPAFDYYTPVIITNENLIQNNPKMIKKFMAALSKGYEYCINDPEKAAEIMIKAVPELGPDLVKASQIFLAGAYQAEADKWGVQKESVWSTFTDWMAYNKLIPSAIDIDKAYTNEFLP